MKKFVPLLFILCFQGSRAQTTNDVLNLLITNKAISQEQADSLRAEAAIRQQESDAVKKSFLVNAARQIQISGYAQVRYQILDEAGKEDGFDVRRARLDLKGEVSPYFAYRFQTDFSGGPKIIDAYAEIKLSDYFNITVGQFKVPFSMENLTSSGKMELIDRSQVVEALVARGKDVIGNYNGRDIGAQVGGTLIKNKGASLVEYRLGIFNGSGTNIADTSNEAKDVSGRLIFNPIKGLSLGFAYYNGWGKAIKPTTEFIGKSQTRNRFGLDISYTVSRLSIRGEYIQGKDGNVERAGWYAQAGYFLIPQKLQALAKYDTYDSDTATEDNTSDNYVMGLNYNFNSWSRLQAFYTFRDEQGTEMSNNYVSVQFQIGF